MPFMYDSLVVLDAIRYSEAVNFDFACINCTSETQRMTGQKKTAFLRRR
jgi:hypothetical protein